MRIAVSCAFLIAVVVAIVKVTTVEVATVDADELEFRPQVVGNLVGRFQPITEVPVVPGRQARLLDNELVLGVVLNGHARAYPINMLTGPSREILNDQLGQVPIAATW